MATNVRDNTTSPLDLEAIRADFPNLAIDIHGRPLVYLDNAATTHKPHAVIDRVLEFYRVSNSAVHRGIHHLSEQAELAYEGARETVGRFIHAADVREVVFTHGATESINIVADCFRDLVRDGDEVVISEMEHHSNLVPWQMLCGRSGATLRIVPFDESGALCMDELERSITSRTKLVAVAHVSNVLGTVNPVQELAAIAHAHGAAFVVDAAQSVPHMPVDVQSIDCDFLVFSGHKMYAETGIGVLYGKKAWLDRLPPSRFGGGMVGRVDRETTTFAEPPFKFEAGTPNVAGAISLGAAIEYLDTLGMDAVQEHEHSLMQYAVRRLSEIDGLEIYGTTSDKCGALAYNLAGVGAYDVATILDKLGIAVRSGTHCAELVMRHYGLKNTVRASFGVYNLPEEIDVLADGILKAKRMLL